MNRRKLLLLLALAALLSAGSWLSWRSWTTPAPPSFALTGVGPELIEAVDNAVREVRREPRSATAWGELSRVLIANDLYEQALPCLGQTQTLDPQSPVWPYLHGAVAIRVSRPREGIPRFRQALLLATVPEERQAIGLALVQALIEEGELEEAEQRLNCCRDGDPARVQFCSALLALARENWPEARADLRPLTQHPCAAKQALTLLANLARDDDQLAASYRQQAAQIPFDLSWPSSFDAGVHQYRVAREPIHEYKQLMSSGQEAEAMELLRQVVRQTPTEEACVTLGVALVKRNELVEAEKALHQALELNPRNAKAHLFRGVALLEQGQRLTQSPGEKDRSRECFRQAIEAADAVLGLQQNHGYAHFIRGRALKNLGRTSEAIPAFRRAALAAPDLWEAYTALGEALAESGQLAEALEHLGNAVRVAPPDNPVPRQAFEKWRSK